MTSPRFPRLLETLGLATVLLSPLWAAAEAPREGVSQETPQEAPREAGVMLRTGDWGSIVSTHGTPALTEIPATQWPVHGWYRFEIAGGRIHSESVQAPSGDMPGFLRTVASQVEQAPVDATLHSVAAQTPEAQEALEAHNEIYLHVPGKALREGSLPVHLFSDGTPQLAPQLGHRYELQLAGGQRFSFQVTQGERVEGDARHPGGAKYTVQYDGASYEYLLGQDGWDSTVQAIADLDGDGKPDFIISVGGENSGYEAVLLSSEAKPGRNLPTASLFATGC